MGFAVREQPPGLPPLRHSAHARREDAVEAATLLVRAYVSVGWRLVERLRDAGHWRRWVLRRDAEWAAVEVREEQGDWAAM